MFKTVVKDVHTMTQLKERNKRKSMPTNPNDITNNLVLPLWNDKAVDVVDRFFAPNADIRTTFINGTGPEILKKSVQDTFSAFPTFEIKIDDIIQQEHKLMYKWQAKAKHEGTILGVPGTGQETVFSGMVFGEVENNKISVYHSFSNIPQVLRALYESNPLIEQLEDAKRLDESRKNVADELRKTITVPLTNREIECLSLWVKGCSIKETAMQMGGISIRTIQTYRENIKHKFRVRNFQKLFGIIQESGALTILLR